MTMSIERGQISAETRLLLGTGFCGGFTTMSTFSYETIALLQYGNTVSALTNIGLSLASCLIAVWVGSIAGRVL